MVSNDQYPKPLRVYGPFKGLVVRQDMAVTIKPGWLTGAEIYSGTQESISVSQCLWKQRWKDTASHSLL